MPKCPMSNYQWPIIKETSFDLVLYLLIAEFEVRDVNYGHIFFFHTTILVE